LYNVRMIHHVNRRAATIYERKMMPPKRFGVSLCVVDGIEVTEGLDCLKDDKSEELLAQN
jgi:hypothetical protein